MAASHLPTTWEMHPTLGMLQLMLAAQLQVEFKWQILLLLCQDDPYHHRTAAACTSVLRILWLQQSNLLLQAPN